MAEIPDHDNALKWKATLTPYWTSKKVRWGLAISLLLGLLSIVLWDYWPYRIKNETLSKQNASLEASLQSLKAVNEERTIKITELQLEVQNLRIAYIPFQNLAKDIIGSTDTNSMKKLLGILTNLVETSKQQNATISNLQDQLKIQTDPKTQAANLQLLSTNQIVMGSNTNLVSYLFETNGASRIILKLKHVPLANSLKITAINPPSSQLTLLHDLHNNIAFCNFEPSPTPLDLHNWRFNINYIINPAATKLVNTVCISNANIYLDGEQLQIVGRQPD